MSTKTSQKNASTTNNQVYGYKGEPYKMSKHKPIDIKPTWHQNYVLNGKNNYNFKRYKDAYDDSPTHASIVNSYVRYIFGDGLIDLNGKELWKWISDEDVHLMCLDLKLYGGFSYQVIFNENNTPLKIEYLPIYKLAVNYDESRNYQTDGFWYCYDWTQKGRYGATFYPKFTGEYKGNSLEIGYYRLPTAEPFFPVPDYFSGLQWAEVEGELANAAANHFKNAVSDITLINYNGGRMATAEAAKAEADKRRSQIVGTDNESVVLMSFNDGVEESVTIDRISPPELNNQNVFYSEEAERKLIIAHSAPPILFSGSNQGSGFSSNADEISMATKMLYRKNVNPLRKVLLTGLGEVFWLIDNLIKLDFKDFDSEDELDNTTNTDIVGSPDMKVITDDNALTGNDILDQKTLDAQASLKGSVGGVQALLDIQASYSAGTTTYESAISMLDIIFGYTRSQSEKLLGSPEKTNSVL